MNRLQNVLSDAWTIRRRDLDNQMALILPAVRSGRIEEAVAMISKKKCHVKAASDPNLACWLDLDDMSLPMDSIAVITLEGCLYSWESEWLASKIAAAQANPSICGIVLAIDGPGGMVSHVESAVKAIEECDKPVATVVTGVMASAHFWIGTTADRIFISSRLCEVGSVGVVFTFCDYSKYFEMNGIDCRDIYPDTADLKNKPYRVLKETGDESLYKERAEYIHKIFSETVARNLGVAYDPSLPLFRGEMFMAEEALSLGYVDEYGDIADAARWVLATAASLRARGY